MLKKIGLEGVDWIHVAHDRYWVLVIMVMNLLVPYKAGHFLISFS
jgi:hypothetical protein